MKKELKLEYDIWEDDKSVDMVIYSEYGEVVEKIDITELNWEERTRILEEKYPEFPFWREG